MDIRELFINVVGSAQDIPEPIRANVSAVGEIRTGQMTQSYLDFLDRESHHNPRGPKWENLMSVRRAHLLPYLDAQFAQGIIRLEGRMYIVMIAHESGSVIHWEEW
jgi:hypothetical protein